MNQIYNIGCHEGMEDLHDGSVDIIFTDPPYTSDLYREAYGILAEHAPRVLRPGGWLLTYAPQYYLPEIMEILGGGLKYYWIVAQFNKQNRNSIIYSRRVMAMWKPILIYSNPPTKQPPKPFCDLISGKRQKDYHLWQQSIHEALHLLSRFAQPWDLVVDPFAGSGTILLASKLLGLSSIGYEIDRDTYVSAIRRMEQEPLDLISFSDHTTCDVKQEVADDG